MAKIYNQKYRIFWRVTNIKGEHVWDAKSCSFILFSIHVSLEPSLSICIHNFMNFATLKTRLFPSLSALLTKHMFRRKTAQLSTRAKLPIAQRPQTWKATALASDAALFVRYDPGNGDLRANPAPPHDVGMCWNGERVTADRPRSDKRGRPASLRLHWAPEPKQ